MQDKIDLLKSQQEDIYSSYGKFAVEFENLCRALRINILFAHIKYGLSEQEITRIMLADLTAYPLIIKCRAIIAFIYKEKPEFIRHLDPIFKACLNINEKRNVIIHGSWSFTEINEHNINSDHSFNKVSGYKNKISKKGVKMDILEFGSEEFNSLTKQVKHIQSLIYDIQKCYQLNTDVIKTISIEKINAIIKKDD